MASKLPHARVKLMIHLHKEGKTIEEIAKQLQHDKRTVHRYLKTAGYFRKTGAPGKRNGFWKGGRNIDDDGYVLIYAPDHPNARVNNYVLEHRLVMERSIGRFLTQEEVVHHVDGDRANNHPDNLVLFSCNGNHLEHELAGKQPNWTKEGLQRLKRHWLWCRNKTNQQRLKSGVGM